MYNKNSCFPINPRKEFLMALCKTCKTRFILCGDVTEKKCASCGNKLEEPENEVCEDCSREKNLCDYCGKLIEKNT